MKLSLICYFLIGSIFLSAQTRAEDASFSVTAVSCKPITIIQEQEPQRYELGIEILTSKIYEDGIQDAVAVVTNRGSRAIHTGSLTVYEYNGRFISLSEKKSIELSLSFHPRASSLSLKNLVNGEWVTTYEGAVSCEFLQYGSEGAHN
jgi:hypothetical protein